MLSVNERVSLRCLFRMLWGVSIAIKTIQLNSPGLVEFM